MDDHEPFPREWTPGTNPFEPAPVCGDCGREIVTDLPEEGQSQRWWHVDGR